MSTVKTNKIGHPVAGIILGIVGIAIAVLMTLLFGVIAGAVAAALGIGAALLGISARKKGGRGVGAIVAGVLALVMAVSMTFTSANLLKTMKNTAVSSGVAPNFAKYMDNPYLGVACVAVNAANDIKDNGTDMVKTLQGEMDALRQYMANAEHSAAPAAQNPAPAAENPSTAG